MHPNYIKIKVHINGNSVDYCVATGTTTSTLASDKEFLDNFAITRTVTVLVGGKETKAAIQPGEIITIKSAPRVTGEAAST